MKAPPRHSEGREFYDDGYESFSEANNSSVLGGRMAFEEAFCGREEELQKLLKVFRQGLSTEQEWSFAATPIVLVSGRSGSGKSRLIDRVLHVLQAEASKGQCKPFVLLSGEFEELEGDPYSAIVEAFHGLATTWSSGLTSDNDREQMSKSISNALGDELDALLSFLPGLSEIVGKSLQRGRTNIMVENAKNLLHYVLLLLVKAISTTEKPVILFLDDLQWIDGESLDLLLSIALAEGVKNFMVVGAYRSNELDRNQSLVKGLHEVESQVTTIPLANWSISDVESFVSQTLSLDLDGETQALAEAIYGKTRGNALFTRQAMEELYRKEFLFYSRISFRWEWNEKGLEQLEAGISEDVLKSIVAKIHNLPSQLQRALVMASYTRSTFDKGILLLILRADKDKKMGIEELTNLLEVAVLEGILSNQVGSRYYKFRHDSFQEAARSLIPRGAEQEKVKQLIGLKLYELVSTRNPSTEDWMVYVAADYLNSTTLTSTDELVFRAKVNMDCGKRAFLVAAFVPASRYFQIGVDTIRKIPDHWESQYEVSLRLFRGLSGVTLALGLYQAGYEYGKALLDNAKSINDKIPTYMSMAVALGREERHLESLELSQAALSLITGSSRRAGSFREKRDLTSVNRYWKRHTNEDILSLPQLTDKGILAQMALYYQVTLRAIVCGEREVWLGTLLPQLQLTTQHGLCGFTPMVFAFYAIHNVLMGDIKAAERASRLAQSIICRRNDKRQEGLTRYMLALHVDCWYNSTDSVLHDLEAGHKSAMEVGDVESGFCNWGGMSLVSFTTGYPLDMLERQGQERIDQMKLYHERAMLNMLLAMRYPVLVLTGKIQNIDWNAFVDDSLDFKSVSKYHWTVYYCLGRLFVAIYFRQFEVAKSLVENFPPLGVEGLFSVSSAIFLTGLQHSGLAQSTGDRKHIRSLRSVTNEMKSLVQNKSMGKMQHRLQILQAELMAVESSNGRRSKAISTAYDESISASLEANFLNDAALVSEFAGAYFKRMGQMELARKYLQQSLSFYEKWGAHAKAQDVRKKL